jgi:hypothetical protein
LRERRVLEGGELKEITEEEEEDEDEKVEEDED